jgi:hypothetical protein
MKTWPATEAVIESASVAPEYRRSAGTRYVHRLHYRFSVAGKIFVGQRVSYGGTPPNWGTETQAHRALPPKGSKITIRYNPHEPSDSVVHVLVNRPADRRWLKWTTGCLSFAGALLMIIAGRGWRRKAREAKAPSLSS